MTKATILLTLFIHKTFFVSIAGFAVACSFVTSSWISIFS